MENMLTESEMLSILMEKFPGGALRQRENIKSSGLSYYDIVFENELNLVSGQSIKDLFIMAVQKNLFTQESFKITRIHQ